jgi:hypothetical protein
LVTIILVTANLSGCGGSSSSGKPTSSIGNIATVAGNGTVGDSGNGGPAITAHHSRER